MTSTQPEQKENWSSEAYQNVASFVPKLATVVLQWLDVQKDDTILDIGCGDGVLNLQIAQILATGTGKTHGIDSSAAMISAAKKAARVDAAAAKVCSFEVLNATSILSTGISHPSSKTQYDKVFSNAAMHWILRPEATREPFFRGIQQVLKPNGIFVFEMGGLGNVAEMKATLLSVISRRVGIQKAREADPWFFPDEEWMRYMLEVQVGGWRVEKMERVYRPTKADQGGAEGWVRLMGKQFFDVVLDEGERETCVKEACGILETVCKTPGGGEWFNYVRLRAVVRKL